LFEAVLSASTAAAVGGVYRALTELFELRRQRRGWTEIRNEIAHSSISVPEQEAASKIALSILRDIKTERKKDLSELTDGELREITETLTRIVEERAAAEPHYDEADGAEILGGLREQYPVGATAADSTSRPDK
jgi:hypothetical protein